MPATTRSLPSAFTSVSRMASFSSKARVALSPSEPKATTPSTPFSICQRAWRPRNSWSTLWSGLKGVVMAEITPVHFMAGPLLDSVVTVWREQRKVDVWPLAGKRLRHELAGDRREAHPHHRMARGDHEVRNAIASSDVRQAVGRTGPQPAPCVETREVGRLEIRVVARHRLDDAAYANRVHAFVEARHFHGTADSQRFAHGADEHARFDEDCAVTWLKSWVRQRDTVALSRLHGQSEA